MNDDLTDNPAPVAGNSPTFSLPPDGAALADGPLQAAARLPFSRWLLEGLRSAFFLQPRVAGSTPLPWQMLATFVLVVVCSALSARPSVIGPARFDIQAFLSTWWTVGVFVGLAWWALTVPHASGATRSPHGGLAGLLVLWLVATLVPELAGETVGAAIVHGWVKAVWITSPWAAWGLFLVFPVWTLVVGVVLLGRYGGFGWRLAVVAVVLAGCTGMMVWQFSYRAWDRDYSAEDATPKRPRLHLTQQAFEGQQELLQRKLEALAPQRPDVTDVYGIVFAPYAEEDVFLRESTLASDVLASRFDADGRVLHLLNHVETTATHPWATPLNLKRAIEAVARRMDRDNDVLVVYMTSHGASDFRLAASHWPLEVDELTPVALREALDAAGVRHRVIAISACFSGGWVDPLANDDTLVMTAADATHTSYGCGKLSPLTFFGRAMFDEQLRKTHSFEKAFAAAVPVIKQREIDAGKADGFSNPQIRVGKDIAPVLLALEQRLDALPQPVAPALPASASAPPVPAAASLASTPASAPKTSP